MVRMVDCVDVVTLGRHGFTLVIVCQLESSDL